MPRWLAPLLRRIHALCAEGRVSFTLKALRELALLDLGLDEHDALEVLRALRAADFRDRLVSESTDEWLYVFNPRISGQVLYVKVIVRAGCVVVSFHEEADDDDEDQ
ncbi:MAG: type II toxin-antitoxin system MqsR family toxin [Deltaproteobacteria bacterium]|nr:type II toxin-antitoxin system MqsR family toxin [Deltaproteobacteria bacterium]